MNGTKKDLEAFAARLRRTRQALHLSQVALAEKVGISNKQLNNVENAHNWPSMPVYVSLCRVLELGEPPLLKDAA
jgi:transcriptional regulator with XRE-family HTH domain